MFVQDQVADGHAKRALPALVLAVAVAVYILAALNRSLWSELHDALAASRNMDGFWTLSTTEFMRLLETQSSVSSRRSGEAAQFAVM